jgi:hydroxymethylpyrimidine pyrophosphatase-like HAD family hydrolase
VRLVATDLDGTLVRVDGSVSTRNLAALTRATRAGATVVLVTGRPHRRVAELAAALPCHPLVVCGNGAIVYDTDLQRVVRCSPFGPDAAASVVARLRERLPGAVFAVEHAAGFGREPGYPLLFDPPSQGAIGSAEELVTLGATKLLARAASERPVGDDDPWSDPQRLFFVAKEAIGDLGELSMSARDGLVEVAARGVTKASALEQLALELGIGAAEVVAFGDMLNDISMLQWAGHGVAMGNAHELVKQAADEVTCSFDKDGVAVVLERLFRDRP